MLQASDLDRYDQVSQFLCSIIDVLCKNGENAEATTVLTLYVDLGRFLFRRTIESFWTNETMSEPETKIKDFKRKMMRVFESIKLQEWAYRTGLFSIIFL